MSGGLTQEVVERRVYLNDGELRFIRRLVDNHLTHIGKKCPDDQTRWITEALVERVQAKVDRALQRHRKDR